MLSFPSRGQIVDRVASLIGDTSAGRAVKILYSVQQAYGDYATHFRWPQLLRLTESSVTASSGAFYLYLPPEVETLFFVYPGNLGSIAQGNSIEALFNEYSVIASTSGLFLKFADAGETARKADFLAGGEALEISQTGLSATTTAYVRGAIVATPGDALEEGYEESVTVSATPGVWTALGSGLTYTDLHSFSVESNDTGRYYIRGATSHTTYASFGPGEVTARYKRIRLFNPPSGDTTLTLGWKKRVTPLNNDAQTIELPIGNAIVNKAIAIQRAEQREFTAVQYHDQLADSEVESAFNASCVQGERIEQGIPVNRFKPGWTRGIVVVNP